MKKVILIALCIVTTVSTYSQVTIGSGNPPHKDAILDLKENDDNSSEKGLLLPRVSLKATNMPSPLSEHVAGMTVYNTAVSPAGTSPENYVSQGFYYNNGTKWERLFLGTTNWFYMPSVAIDTSTPANDVVMDLYNLYKNQFNGTGSNFVKSEDAPSAVPYIPTADQLYFYVTEYDPSVFNIKKIDRQGRMTYDILNPAAESSYINIVFVLK